MKGLLRLFDDILLEEYSPDNSMIPCSSSAQSHAASPSPSNVSSVTLTQSGKGVDDHITCDFCGADIFQSFFECSHCVEQNPLEGSETDERGESYVVCAGCYVEGRSCSCGRMNAVQRQPFDNLLCLRRNALHALHTLTRDDSFLSASKQEPSVSHLLVLSHNAKAKVALQSFDVGWGPF